VLAAAGGDGAADDDEGGEGVGMSNRAGDKQAAAGAEDDEDKPDEAAEDEEVGALLLLACVLFRQLPNKHFGMWPPLHWPTQCAVRAGGCRAAAHCVLCLCWAAPTQAWLLPAFPHYSSLVGVALDQRGGDKSQQPRPVAADTPNPPYTL
jgi:hypothetical protein